MPAQVTFYQRLFNRDLSLSALSHHTRGTITRRHCSDRICCFLILLMSSYILWAILISPYRTTGLKRDPLEELAYKQARNRSSPMVENTQICSLDAVDLLFVIISSSGHFLERQSIRETWGSMADFVGVHSQRLFVIGYHAEGGFYRDLRNEATHEQDLLYLTTDDFATTLKELHAYRWLKSHCANVQYVFKTEDDLFVNSLLLHELVRELKTKPADTLGRTLHGVPLETILQTQSSDKVDKFLFGWAYEPGRPERNNTGSPYVVTYDEYPKELYPRYCSGFGYFMNLKTRNTLTEEGLRDQYPFRFSDIYITGILPERLNFACEILPFVYHQGSIEDCTKAMVNKRNNGTLAPPLLICSTGRHVGRNAYSDYHKLWTELRHVYADKLQSNSAQ